MESITTVLPRELLSTIMTFCGPTHVVLLGRTCKYLHEISKSCYEPDSFELGPELFKGSRINGIRYGRWLSTKTVMIFRVGSVTAYQNNNVINKMGDEYMIIHYKNGTIETRDVTDEARKKDTNGIMVWRRKNILNGWFEEWIGSHITKYVYYTVNSKQHLVIFHELSHHGSYVHNDIAVYYRGNLVASDNKETGICIYAADGAIISQSHHRETNMLSITEFGIWFPLYLITLKS